MVLPLIGAMAGAGGSIGAALIGANASNDASVTNYMIGLMNYYQRQREMFDAQSEARRTEHKQDQGFTDAQGNRTHYVPGQGWVVDLDPQVEALQQREMGERMQSLGHDQTIKRQQLDRNATRSIREGDHANALFDEMRRRPKTNPDELERSFFGEGAKATNRAFDDTAAAMSKQAVRTRSPHGGEILASLARKRSDALSDTAMSARGKALEMAPALDAAAGKEDANLYNMFATRASAMPDVSFAPSQLPEGANGNLQMAARLGNSSNEGRLKAAMMEGPRFPYQPPNYGTANAVGAIGTSLGSLFQQQNSNSGYNALLDEIRKSSRRNTGEFADG